MAPEEVAYVTPTGKAARVLILKGNKNAMTIHKFLYEWYAQANGGYFKKPKDFIAEKLIVIDEISMVEKQFIDQLFKYPDIHVICCGDPFQLPQINKNQDNHLLDNPHIFLSEIMRQAAESHIIRMTMDLRNYIMPTPQNNSNEVKVFYKNELSSGMLTWADQVICATNKNRIYLNNYIRQILGYEGEPQEGEKVICLKNNWDIYDNDENALVNGTIGYLKNINYCSYDAWHHGRTIIFDKKIDILNADLKIDDDFYFKNIAMDRYLYQTEKTQLKWKEQYILNKDSFFNEDHPLPNEFTFGYCISCWKAQGSEFNKVLGFEENHPFDKEEHFRYLYTLCSRASSKLVLILNK